MSTAQVQDSGQTENWSATWSQEMQHLDSLTSASAQLMYIMLNVLPSVSDYYEYTEGQYAQEQEDLTEIANDVSTIQSAYNADDDTNPNYTTSTITGNPNDTATVNKGNNPNWTTSGIGSSKASQQQYESYQADQVAGAYAAANNILAILQSDPSAFGDINDPNSFAGSINVQLQTVLGGVPEATTPNGYQFSEDSENYDTTQNSWNTSWAEANNAQFESASSINDAFGTDYKYGHMVFSATGNADASAMQQYNNAFSALSSQCSGVASSTQSELQLYENEDEKMLGLDNSCMTSNESLVNTITNNYNSN